MPIPHGHRVFGVPDASVQSIIAETLVATGLKEIRRFSSGPSHQIVFEDGTVVNRLDRSGGLNLPSTALTVPVADPLVTAQTLVEQLHHAGHQAAFIEPVKHLPPNSFVVVFSGAFEGWMMGFRSLRLEEIEKQLAGEKK